LVNGNDGDAVEAHATLPIRLMAGRDTFGSFEFEFDG
jgi:hypothetical protein